ncbi:MAG TPA: ABC transporter ATP-binding protein [Burkholderiaceae bacterium]|jgi:ABC-type polysaccharide/polyol phosphate transport system ATPase subunit|nr:ABC transporter ATP-binding protein [Burkholderiaceae bacterium]
MSSEILIKVHNLSKSYQIYAQPHHRLLQGIFRSRKQFFTEFFALKDISFEVKRGDMVGIIGRNGSGKSTLLQILCGTLAPTSGEVVVNGRIAALLELGAGFNPEFTGRENVYMNAAILGLSTKEIDARFDQIVSFADIGDHLEQPVKTYSSGMYMRLAFSIAVSVDPDIFIVDEALSVGDIAFQNKCMARIRKMSDNGTTILFVSHDLGTTQVLCDRVIWLNSGHMAGIGDPVQISRDYYIASLGPQALPETQQEVLPQQETGYAKFVEFKVKHQSHETPPVLEVGGKLTIRFALEALRTLEPTVYGLSIYRSDGDWLIGQTSREAKVVWPGVDQGEVVSGEIVLDPLCLAPGNYQMALGAYSQDLAICYGLTDMQPAFTVRADYPTWGKFMHGIEWKPTTALNHTK